MAEGLPAPNSKSAIAATQFAPLTIHQMESVRRAVMSELVEFFDSVPTRGPKLPEGDLRLIAGGVLVRLRLQNQALDRHEHIGPRVLEGVMYFRG